MASTRDALGVVGNGGSLFFGLYSNAARTNFIGNSATSPGVRITIGPAVAPEASSLLLLLPGLLLVKRRR